MIAWIKLTVRMLVGLLVVLLVFTACSYWQSHSFSKKPLAAENFYIWANWDWLKHTKLPPDKPTINNFVTINDTVTLQLKQLLEELEQRANRTTDEQKLVEIYRAYLDIPQRNRRGIASLRETLHDIDEITDYEHLVLMFGQLQLMGVSVPLNIDVGTDLGQPDRNILYVVQGGLHLERSLYLNRNVRANNCRSLYKNALAKLLARAGYKNPKYRVERVLAVETILASLQVDTSLANDVAAIYNRVPLGDVQDLLPHYSIHEQLSVLGLPTDVPLNLSQETYLSQFDRHFQQIAMEDWKNYLRTRLLLTHAKWVSEAYRNIILEFELAVGVHETPPQLWQEAVEYMNVHVGMLLGKAYVQRYFRGGVKSDVTALTRSIVDEYRQVIERTELFTATTKRKALDKLDKMRFKIGYPDNWQDYSTLQYDPSNLLDIQHSVMRFEQGLAVKRLSQPVNRNAWNMVPQQINAYYNVSQNTFVIPAGILHPPFYDATASNAEKYGSLGFIVAHEIAHAYDYRGSHFNADGVLSAWWQKDDYRNYRVLTARLQRQADDYEIRRGIFLNGAREIGEIIGDMSAAEVALSAFTRKLQNGDGNLDEEQKMFFIQLAKTWRNKPRQEYLAKMIDFDQHPPAEYRANGVVRNMDRFQMLFAVKPGDFMYLRPEDRVRVW